MKLITSIHAHNEQVLKYTEILHTKIFRKATNIRLKTIVKITQSKLTIQVPHI